jgi:hypothetical protein
LLDGLGDRFISPAVVQGFFNSLDHEARNHRYDDIQEPYKSTFQWIYEIPGKQFTEWLKGGRGLFWISGKAGCGKSTMMKFIYDDPRTLHIINSRGYNKDVAKAGFFFHDRGSTLDKSFTGLLRHLLTQVLKEFPGLAPVFYEAVRIRTKLLSGEESNSVEVEIGVWSLQVLKLVVFEVTKQTAVTGDWCIFIDGLDEFEGEDADIADFMRMMVHTGDRYKGTLRISACVSSRPHIEFQDAFRSYPSLVIHEHTQNDILYYASSRIRASAMVERPLVVNTEIVDNLINMVVSRASGVFLWVRLAVNDLLQCLSSGDSFEEIQQQLHELPDDLEGLYMRMLERVPHKYRHDTALLFQIIQCSRQVMSYGEFIISALPISKILTSKLSVKVLDLDNSPESETMKRRVKSRCGGLLEISRSLKRTTENDAVHGAQFLHQTVKEFLGKNDVWVKVFGVPPLHGWIEAHKHIMIASLRQFHRSKGSHTPSMDACVYHAWKVEQLAKESPVELLDSVNELSSTTKMRTGTRNGLDFTGYHWSVPYVEDWYLPLKSWNDDFLTFTIFADLALYVIYKIQQDPSLVRQRKGRPLLHYAVDKTSFIESKFGEPVVINSSLLESFFRIGADPNVKYEGSSAWQLLLRSIIRDEQLIAPFGAMKPRFEAYLACTELMILHGADVNVELNGIDTEDSSRLIVQRWVSPMHLFLERWVHLHDPKVTDIIYLMVNNGANLRLKDTSGASILDQAKGDLSLHAELKRLRNEQSAKVLFSGSLRRTSWSFFKRGGKRQPRISGP